MCTSPRAGLAAIREDARKALPAEFRMLILGGALPSAAQLPDR
jgi:hypothetical protein